MATSAAVKDDEPATNFAKDQLKSIIERIERLEEEGHLRRHPRRLCREQGQRFRREGAAHDRAPAQAGSQRAAGRGNDPRDLYARARDAVRTARPMAGMYHLEYRSGSAAPTNGRSRGTDPGLRRDDGFVAEASVTSLRNQRSAAVRMTKDVVSSLAVAVPEKLSQDMPSIGSSPKPIAITACGLTK